MGVLCNARTHTQTKGRDRQLLIKGNEHEQFSNKCIIQRDTDTDIDTDTLQVVRTTQEDRW